MTEAQCNTCKAPLATDGGYQALLKQKDEREKRLKIEQIELDYQRDMFRAYLALAQMQGARV